MAANFGFDAIPGTQETEVAPPELRELGVSPNPYTQREIEPGEMPLVHVANQLLLAPGDLNAVLKRLHPTALKELQDYAGDQQLAVVAAFAAERSPGVSPFNYLVVSRANEVIDDAERRRLRSEGEPFGFMLGGVEPGRGQIGYADKLYMHHPWGRTVQFAGQNVPRFQIMPAQGATGNLFLQVINPLYHRTVRIEQPAQPAGDGAQKAANIRHRYYERRAALYVASPREVLPPARERIWRGLGAIATWLGDQARTALWELKHY